MGELIWPLSGALGLVAGWLIGFAHGREATLKAAAQDRALMLELEERARQILRGDQMGDARPEDRAHETARAAYWAAKKRGETTGRMLLAYRDAYRLALLAELIEKAEADFKLSEDHPELMQYRDPRWGARQAARWLHSVQGEGTTP